MRREDGFSVINLFLSFLIGGISGAGLVLFLAPKSGRETRQSLKDFVVEAGEKTKEYVKEQKKR